MYINNDEQLRRLKRQISNLIDEYIQHGFFNIMIEGQVARRGRTLDIIVSWGPCTKHRIPIDISHSEKETG